MSLSNDSLEGRLVKRVLMTLAKRDGIDADGQRRIASMLDQSLARFDGLAFCLSEQGDLLSQWRGYGDDGKGVSIGFNSDYLESLGTWHSERGVDSFRLRQVAYDDYAHEALVEDAYTKFQLVQQRLSTISGTASAEGDPESPSRAPNVDALLLLLPRFFMLKASSFSEEREWRLLSIWLHPMLNQIQFRSDKARVIPYRAFELPISDMPQIVELVVGPKNDTPLAIIDRMLAQAGFADVSIRCSAISYR